MLGLGGQSTYDMHSYLKLEEHMGHHMLKWRRHLCKPGRALYANLKVVVKNTYGLHLLLDLHLCSHWSL